MKSSGVPRCPDDLTGRRVLADEAGGTGLHGGEDLVIAGVHRQHDQAGGVAYLPDRPHDVQPGPVLQLQVGHHDVGVLLVVLRQGLEDGAGLVDDRHVLLELEHARQPAADELVVIHEKDTDGLGHDVNSP